MSIRISHLDHLVLTVRDIDATCEFYSRVLGFTVEEFKPGRRALKFGEQKINLHQQGREFEPKAEVATPGSADLCFISQTPLDEVVARLRESGVVVLEGPVARTGAVGTILSVYFCDPDGNLIEVSTYQGRNV